MPIIGGHGLRRRRLLSSISSFRGRSGLSYSSSSAAEATQSPVQTHFMVNYLVNSLGFSSKEAISASKKLTHLKSTQNPDSVINFFKQNGFDNAQIRRIVSSFGASLSTNVQKTLEPKFKFMQSVGISGSDLAKLVTDKLQEVVRRAEEEFGIPRESPMFPHGMLLASCNKSTLQNKFRVLESFGWKESEINTLVRKLPCLLSLSEANIRNRLYFFMHELGYSPEYLLNRSAFFTCSLEKRIIPRNDVFRILKDKKLLKGKVELHTLLYKSEEKFLQQFLLPYVVFVPDLYQAYMKRMEQ